jgi:hypothetical protein
MGVEPTKDGITLTEGLCTLAGDMILAEGLHNRRRQAASLFSVFSGICLTTEEKHGKPQSW